MFRIDRANTKISLPGLSVSVLALALASCAPSAQQQECEVQSDCPAGEVCDNQRCVPFDNNTDGGPQDDSSGVPLDGTTGEDALVVCDDITVPWSNTEEYVEVPQHAVWMHVKAWGAGGNDVGQCAGGNDGGMGGYSEAAFEVAPGMVLEPGGELTVIVGYPGSATHSPQEVFRFGFGSTGGGGLSGVFLGWGEVAETDQDRAILIAGGGGSGGIPCEYGGTGNHSDPSIAGGRTTMMGGVGEGDDNFNGGGGGYFGGSGGVGWGASNGGKGFVDDVLARPDFVIQASEPGTGDPPNTTDEDYVDADNVGRNESRGHVVIRFLCGPPDPIVL